MNWTTKYYLHQSDMWREKRLAAEKVGKDGGVAYASRKVAMWLQLASQAKTKFKAVNLEVMSGRDCLLAGGGQSN